MNGTEWLNVLESMISVPPLVSYQKWPWSIMRHGLIVWLDPDSHEHLTVLQKDKVRKMKFPKKKAAFGPAKAPDLLTPNDELPGDPIDMWGEADVHVDLNSRPDVSRAKLVLASIINAILDSPPKWRGWMKQAKVRGTIGADYQTPFEERRAFHSNGISPRLNRLLKA